MTDLNDDDVVAAVFVIPFGVVFLAPHSLYPSVDFVFAALRFVVPSLAMHILVEHMQKGDVISEEKEEK